VKTEIKGPTTRTTKSYGMEGKGGRNGGNALLKNVGAKWPLESGGVAKKWVIKVDCWEPTGPKVDMGRREALSQKRQSLVCSRCEKLEKTPKTGNRMKS